MYVSESTLSSAKTICSLSGWKLSNLPLQKLLYLSHMIALGEANIRLAGSNFQAWDLGPVEPNLYHKVKAYGDGPIPDIFNVPEYATVSQECKIIYRVVSELKDATPGKLVAITHQAWGAWAAHYKPRVMGIEIPENEIKREYTARIERGRRKQPVSD